MILEKIHKITKEQTQKLIYWGLVILTFLLPVPQLFFPDATSGIRMQAMILTLIFCYFGAVFFVECKNKRFCFREIGLPIKCVFGLVMVGIISVLISGNTEISLYGSEVRCEGLFSLLSYYMIFLISTCLKDSRYRRNLVYLFLLFGSLVTVLGVIQYTGIYTFGERLSGAAYVPMRNPNFFGGYAVLFTGAGMGGFFSYDKESEITHPFPWWNRMIWYVLVLLGYTACICAKSTLVYAGLFMMLLMYLFLEVVSKRRNFLSFVLLVVGLFGLLYLFNLQKDGAVVAEIKTVSNQIKAEGTVFGDRVGSGRMRIWKQTISLLPKYGLFGCGIEQLGNYCYEGSYTSGFLFDKAHNEYLNLWVTEGFFALVIYLIFLFALFIPGIRMFLMKRKQTEVEYAEDIISKIAFFAFFGYIAQAFFNISVIQVAPYFWMICGLLYSRKRMDDEGETNCRSGL